METPLLRDQEIFPSEEVLKEVLGRIYPVYESFMKAITNAEYALNPEWNYYKDGKSRLITVGR